MNDSGAAALRVAILGAGGTIAPAIVRDLAESDEVAGLLLLDLDEARAEHVASAYGGPKARAALADARASADAPASLARALEGCDVLVNSASYRVNLDAMTACLAAGCHYLDLGGLYWMTGRQLELGPRFEAAGLLALLGIGSAPGKTNLMALQAARELRGAADPAAPASEQARMTGRPPGSLVDEEAAGIDSMEVSAAGRDLDPPPGFSVPYALQTLLDELTMRPVVLRDGEPEEIDPLAPGGVVEFGEPIGASETIYTLHSELLTFGDSFGCREATFRLSLSPDLLSRLRELTEAPEEEIKRLASEAVPPSGKTVSVHLVDAHGGGRSVRVRALTEPNDAWGLGGGVVSTAAPAAAAVRLLARGSIEARGAVPPERCIEPAEMFGELERHGCTFEITTREEARA